MSEYVECAELGDAIGANCVVIAGNHPIALGSLPGISIAKRRVPSPSMILDHINMEMNTTIFALKEIDPQDLNDNNIQCPTRSSRPITIAKARSTSKLDNRDLILHSVYPGVECIAPERKPERQSFLIPYICTLTLKHYIKALHSSEVVALYTSTISPTLRQQLHRNMAGNNSCKIVRRSCRWITGMMVAEYIADAAISHDIVQKEDFQFDIVRCNLTQPVPTKEKWQRAYREDKETNYIMTRLNDDTEWQERELKSVHRAYRPAIREKRVIQSGRLVILSPIADSNKFTTLIVVPEDLRITIFQTYHSTGVGGHRGANKTLLTLRLRFFWPGMRSQILSLVQQCAGCIPTTSRR